MATVTQLPAPIPSTTRDREVEKMKRSVRIRVPAADTGTGTQPDTDARMLADVLMPLYATARINSDNAVMENARGAAQDQWARREGVAARREAFGASGAVTYAGSAGGSTILAGDEIRNESTGLRYEVITTDTYIPGDPINVVGKDTGPETNLAVGSQLKWTSPRPGCSDFALVATGGLSGGRDKENDDELLIRIENEKQNRAASGNDADYQLAVESTPNVAVQKAFTWPAVSATGTMCFGFMLLPEHSGGSRCANAAQVSLVETHLYGQFPGDDGAMAALFADEDADVVYEIDWSVGAAGWADLAPWPAYYAVTPSSGPGAIRVSAATSATSFTLSCANGIYTGVRQPTVGQTLAFYDSDAFTWRRKRIGGVTGTGPWVVTCDTTNNASDTGYTPQVTQRACPWSDSLPSILYTAPVGDAPAKGLWAYFDTLGPGEQVATFYDEGVRQRRQPPPTLSWPSRLSTRGLIDYVTAVEVADIDVLEGDQTTPTVGSPGVLAYVLLLRFVSAFPKTI